MILVTGASGLLGQKVKSVFADKGKEVVGTYHSKDISEKGMHKVDLVPERALRNELKDPIHREAVYV